MDFFSGLNPSPVDNSTGRDAQGANRILLMAENSHLLSLYRNMQTESRTETKPAILWITLLAFW